MSGVAYTLTVDNAEILAGLARIRRVSDDLTPLMTDIGGELESSTVMRFTTNVAPDGTPWKARLKTQSNGLPILVMTTDLRDSIHAVVERDAVSIGSALVYAAVHQEGFHGEVVVSSHERHFTMVFGRRISGVTNVMPHSRQMNIPARKYLGMSVNDNDRVIETVGDHWARAARGAA